MLTVSSSTSCQRHKIAGVFRSEEQAIVTQFLLFFLFLSYSTEIGQFQKIVGGLIELVDELAKEAETEKMKVMEAIQSLL